MCISFKKEKEKEKGKKNGAMDSIHFLDYSVKGTSFFSQRTNEKHKEKFTCKAEHSISSVIFSKDSKTPDR